MERALDLLFILPGRDRLGAHVFTALLAAAANDCSEATSDLAHHAARCCRVRMGDRRRKVFFVVAFRGVFRARRRVDDFPKRRGARGTSQNPQAGDLFAANMNSGQEKRFLPGVLDIALQR